MTFQPALPRPTDLWPHHASSGDWEQDTQAGKDHADKVVASMRAAGNPTALGHMMKAMVIKGGYYGFEVGFFHRISERLLEVTSES